MTVTGGQAPNAVVLVEGLSDSYAVEAAAARAGRTLESEGVAVVPMGGVTNVDRFLARFGPSSAPVAALCDAAEAGMVARAIDRAGIAQGARLFICHRDLEDELIRAAGPSRVEALIEHEGELRSLRKLQQMPFHQGRSIEDQLRRFIGTKSGRKHRYAPLLVDALEPAEVPLPLRELLAYV